jgi:hypothetical protein
MRLLAIALLLLVSMPYLYGADSTIEQKLELIIPQIKLDGVTLSQAIDAVRRHTRDLDPDKTGLNIIVQGENDHAEKKISLNLSNIPVKQALHYISKSAGLFLSVKDNVVLISNKVDDQLMTRIYKVSSSFKTYVDSKDPLNITEEKLKKFLSITGLSFPEGSSVIYIPSKNILSLNNTLDNQEKAHKALVNLGCLR